jgi:hypothetical protein
MAYSPMATCEGDVPKSRLRKGPLPVVCGEAKEPARCARQRKGSAVLQRRSVNQCGHRHPIDRRPEHARGSAEVHLGFGRFAVQKYLGVGEVGGRGTHKSLSEIWCEVPERCCRATEP